MHKSETYRVTIDYTQTLDEMIKGAKFDYFNSQINSTNFPISGDGVQEREIVLVNFSDNITTTRAEAEIKKSELRPARVEEMVMLATQYPDLQTTGRAILGIGSVYKRSATEHVFPVLRGNDEEPDRNMHVLRMNNKYSPCDCFACVKPENSE